MKISAIVIAKNEEKMIEDCLKSLNFVDEILVVDTGNIDKTNTIAKKYGARIVKYTGSGSFSDWRNKGLREAKGDWILYVDADERITPTLCEELKKITQKEDSHSAYAIARRNFIFGKEFKHSGQYPDYQKRFFKKKDFIKWTGHVHEEQQFKGELVHLKIPMLHIKHE